MAKLPILSGNDLRLLLTIVVENSQDQKSRSFLVSLAMAGILQDSHPGAFLESYLPLCRESIVLAIRSEPSSIG